MNAAPARRLLDHPALLTAARTVPALVILAAAAAKAWSPGGDEVWSWFGIPPSLHTPLDAALVASETAAAASLLVFSRSRLAAWASILMLALLTLVLLLLLASRSAPACHCLGVLRLFRSERMELGAGVLRNLTLIALMLWWCAGTTAHEQPRRDVRSRSG